MYKKAACFFCCSVPGLYAVHRAWQHRAACQAFWDRQAKIQVVLQLDEADYSLEAGQHQWIHTNANALLDRANICVQRLCGDRVNICWTSNISLCLNLSFHLGEGPTTCQTAWCLHCDQKISEFQSFTFQSKKETHLLIRLLGWKTSPKWRGSRSMPRYPRKGTGQRSDSRTREFITSAAGGTESREKRTNGGKEVMMPKQDQSHHTNKHPAAWWTGIHSQVPRWWKRLLKIMTRGKE